MLNKITRILVTLIIVVTPIITNAKIIINEIMYDPEGTDTGREWIEIYNDGSESIDLATLRLNENNVNHTMKPWNKSDAILGAGQYAIVADNPDKFLLDYTNYSALLIDSAFSLNNSGEVLSILDSESNVINTVTYSSEWGAGGNGNSLQLHGGIWIPGEVTLIAENVSIPADESVAEESGTSTSSTGGSSGSDSTSSHSAQADLSSFKPKIALEIGIGRDRVGFINSPIEFYAEHNLESGSGIKYLWSFGDGDSNKGKKIAHAYYFPGEYNVITNASKNGSQAVSRIKVSIKEPNLIVTLITRGKLVDIMLENKSKFEINIGGFKVRPVGRKTSKAYIFPRDTIISSGQTVYIPGEISGQSVEKGGNLLSIFYPNGKIFLENLSVVTGTSSVPVTSTSTSTHSTTNN